MAERPKRQISEPDIFHEPKTLRNFRHEIVGHDFLVAAKSKFADQLQRFAGRQRREIIDRLILQPDVPRDRIQARPVAGRAWHRFLFIDPFRFPLRRQFVFQNRIAGILRARLLGAIPNFAETAAFLAGAVRRIEGEQAGIEFFKSAPAAWTAHLRAHDRETMFCIEQVRGAATDIERALDQIPRFQDSFRVDRADHNVDRVFLEPLEFSELRNREEFAIDEKRIESLPFRPARDIGVKSFSRLHQRRQDLERAAFHRRLELFHDRGKALFFDRQIAIGTKLRPGFGEEEPEKMVNFRHGGDG